MGLAVIVDRETCLALQGLRCEICYRVCPLLDKAISLETRVNPRTGIHTIFEPVVHSDGCVGCGRCEEACPTDEAAIKVLSLSTARGKLGEHYRLGWKVETS
jgi:ferredoxin-type protein NapG